MTRCVSQKLLCKSERFAYGPFEFTDNAGKFVAHAVRNNWAEGVDHASNNAHAQILEDKLPLQYFDDLVLSGAASCDCIKIMRMAINKWGGERAENAFGIACCYGKIRAMIILRPWVKNVGKGYHTGFTAALLGDQTRTITLLRRWNNLPKSHLYQYLSSLAFNVWDPQKLSEGKIKIAKLFSRWGVLIYS